MNSLYSEDWLPEHGSYVKPVSLSEAKQMKKVELLDEYMNIYTFGDDTLIQDAYVELTNAKTIQEVESVKL